MNPQSGGATGSTGCQDPLCEDVLFGHPKDLYVLGTGSYIGTLAPHLLLNGREMDVD